MRSASGEVSWIFLEGKGIKLLPWPPLSPDMNPIENAWAIPKQNLHQQSMYPTSKDGIFERLPEVWDSLSTE